MVTVNFTLVVLLVMFLAFLGAMHRLIFTPLLALMDRRNDQIADDKQTAIKAAEEATALEDDYGAKIAQIHREASVRLGRAHRQAQEEHHAHVAAFKAKAEKEIATLAQSLAGEIDSQRDQFDALSSDIHHAMAKKLELE